MSGVDLSAPDINILSDIRFRWSDINVLLYIRSSYSDIRFSMFKMMS